VIARVLLGAHDPSYTIAIHPIRTIPARPHPPFTGRAIAALAAVGAGSVDDAVSEALDTRSVAEIEDRESEGGTERVVPVEAASTGTVGVAESVGVVTGRVTEVVRVVGTRLLEGRVLAVEGRVVVPVEVRVLVDGLERLDDELACEVLDTDVLGRVGVCDSAKHALA